jgi:hypothetical protein
MEVDDDLRILQDSGRLRPRRSPYGSGSEAKMIRREYPDWTSFNQDNHPEYQQLMCMMDRTEFTVGELKYIADEVAKHEGIQSLGRPFSRRKAGIAKWIAENWDFVKSVVSLGIISLPPQKNPHKKGSRSSALSTNGEVPLVLLMNPPHPMLIQQSIDWTAEQIDEEEELGTYTFRTNDIVTFCVKSWSFIGFMKGLSLTFGRAKSMLGLSEFRSVEVRGMKFCQSETKVFLVSFKMRKLNDSYAS